MTIRAFIGTVFVLLLSANIAAQPASADQTVEIDELAQAFRDGHKIPGLSVAVGHRGNVVYAKAFGLSDLENAVKATEDTVFRTASIAKPITAVAVLQLVDQGKIGLDDPIQKHCPEFPTKDRELTVRQLLCHQGGIRHYKSPGEATGTKHYGSIGESIELFAEDPLLFEPGTRFSYTTYGYSLLGRAVETASGKSFREYLQENIFDPAEMEDAGLDDTFRIIPNRTRGYVLITVSNYFALPLSQRKQLKLGQVVNCQLHDTSMKVPGGGLICTPTDLVKFGQEMLADKLIKAATKEIAWQSQNTSEGESTDYGLGWRVINDGVTTISHSGGQAGTSTILGIVPEQDTVVAVMSNLQGSPVTQLALQIGAKYAELIGK